MARGWRYTKPSLQVASALAFFVLRARVYAVNTNTHTNIDIDIAMHPF